MALITGSGGPDFLTDTADADFIEGRGGNDTLVVSAGDDRVLGGSGKDTLRINYAGTNTGSTFWNYGAANIAWIGPAFVSATTRVDFDSIEHLDVRAGSGDDQIRATENSWDKIDGGAGTDTWRDKFEHRTRPLDIDMQGVSSGAWQDLGEGSQVRNLEVAELWLGQANDRFRDFGLFDDTVYGNDGNDRIAGGNGNDTFYGGNGTDRLEIDWRGVPGAVTIDGTTATVAGDASHGVTFYEFERLDADLPDSDDFARGFSGDDSIDGNGGADHLIGGLGNDTLRGGPGDDRIEGGGDTDSLFGGADDDQILGGPAKDYLYGEDGADRLDGEDGDDFLFGGAGDDRLDGGNGRDRLWGDLGDDDLAGGADADRLFGEKGADMLAGGAGADRLDGGGGRDVGIYRDSAEGVSVNLSTGRGRGGDAAGDRLGSVESLDGSDHDDRLFGSARSNTLDGYDGRDRLYGRGGDDLLLGGADNDRLAGDAGDDRLFGGEGDDSLSGGAGADALTGGDGTDTADYAGSDAVDVDLGAGTARGGDAEGDTLASIENLAGGARNDRLTGDGLSNTLWGRGGNDKINGGGGADILRGGDGNDRIAGEGGDDRMSGDAGRDRFVFNGGEDRIEDFTDDEDTIQLDAAALGQPGLTVGGALALATVVAEGVLFDFGGGNTLLLEGWTATAGLEDDLLIA